MATKNSTRSNTRRPRDSEGKFTEKGWTASARENPYTTAAIAAGVAGVGAFLWSRRGQIAELAEAGYDRASEIAESGMDRLSELKAERMGGGSMSRTQAEIAEEALSLKQTGEKAEPFVAEQGKASATAY